MSEAEQMIKSVCRSCHGGCGVKIYLKDGKAVRIEGDPEFPTNHGSLCSKGIAAIQMAYHPDRVTHPLRRKGKKGEGKWQRISWEEALDTIAERYRDIIERCGAESIVFGHSTGRELIPFMDRFRNLLGSPNEMSPGHMCYIPSVGVSLIICGYPVPVCDYGGSPRCVVLWGSNAHITNPDEYKAENLLRALSTGAKLIVIDPRFTYLAARADIWLQPRPGTDAALAFGILNVIIEEGLYDREFVERYVHGWEEFCRRVEEYPLRKVEEITWVPQEKIRQAARLFAQTHPACIHRGVAVEQTLNCIDNDRLLIALMAVTGNLDIPGGNVFYNPPPIRQLFEYNLGEKLPREQKEKELGGDKYKMAHNLPFGVVTPKVVWDAILTEKPYPVKAVQLHASNPVVTRANAREVYQALSEVEFLVVADLFLTPTAELADIVLPAASWLEQDEVAEVWKSHGYAFARRKAIQVGECWPDTKIFNELGKKMGQGDYWWEDVEQAMDYILEPSGLTWQQFKEEGILKGEMRYQKYLEKGFPTSTGKVELYSTALDAWGYDPLPQYHEVPESPASRPDMVSQYPYILITGARSPIFYHSEHRMLPWLREIHPDPIVELNPQTAAENSIRDGQWVYIESPRGRVKQKARLTLGIDPRVVSAQHGWWFPEKKDPGHGWDESNINILTENDLDHNDPAFGSTNLRVLMCKVYPVQGER